MDQLEFAYKLLSRIGWLIDWLIDWYLTSSEQFFSYIQDENMFTINQYVSGKRGTDRPMGKQKFKRHGTRNKERWWVGTENLTSATSLPWTVTLGSLTCKEGGNLSTRYLGFIYVSSEGRIGCEFIHPAQPTDTPSSRRSSRSQFYTPGFPRSWPLLED